MSISGSTIIRATSAAMDATTTIDLGEHPDRVVDEAPVGLADVSCWKLLTARVPLTLLLDLALPTGEDHERIYAELLDEESSVEWVPAARRPRT